MRQRQAISSRLDAARFWGGDEPGHEPLSLKLRQLEGGIALPVCVSVLAGDKAGLAPPRQQQLLLNELWKALEERSRPHMKSLDMYLLCHVVLSMTETGWLKFQRPLVITRKDRTTWSILAKPASKRCDRIPKVPGWQPPAGAATSKQGKPSPRCSAWAGPDQGRDEAPAGPSQSHGISLQLSDQCTEFRNGCLHAA